MERKYFTSIFHFFILILVTGFVISCQHNGKKTTAAGSDTLKINGSLSEQSQQNANAMPAGSSAEPKNPVPAVNSADQGIKKGANGEFILDHTSQRDPNNPDTRMLNAFTRNAMNNLNLPMNRTIDPEKRKAQELYVSGSQKSLSGDQKGAIEDYTQSIGIYKMALTYMKRGYCELLLKDYDNAIKDMNETLKMDTNQERAYFGRGVCRFETQDFKAAAEDMEHYIAKNRTNPMAFNYLAGCKFMAQDIKKALENYEMVVKIDPKFPDIYTNRGMMKHYLNDLKGAVEDYNKALSIDPDNATAYNNRGAAKLNQNDAKSAMEDFNKAISLKGDYADAYVNRGKAKFILGDKTGACEDWQKSYKYGLVEARDLISKHCRN